MSGGGSGRVQSAPIPDETAWQAWHPHELARRLQGLNLPWYVVGGWALDLWHGQPTREHEDLEYCVLRSQLPAFCQHMRALGLDLFTAHSGVLAPLAPGELPAAHIAQIWCWDAAAQAWRADMMVEAGTPDTWVYKRSTDVTRPRTQAVWQGSLGEGPSLPHLSPGAVLLFKAKQPRTKDQTDFERALPRLQDAHPAERDWLRAQLMRLHPGHAWLLRL